MQNRQLSRRSFLTLAGATGGAALLAACAPAEVEVDQSAAADDSGEAMPDVDRVPVRVWIGGSYTPTEWTSRSAENPIVVNAPRILAERYHEENPGTEIVYEEGPGGEDYFAWLTAGATAGTAPNLVRSTHNFAVQNGWAVAIDDYLAQPNRYAPDYDKWIDIFYPTFMNSLIQPDGKIYCAPIDNIWPNIEVGLAYNKETFDSMGLEPPSTWSAQMEVSRALKEAGDGLAPWQVEQATGNLWPLALQILPSMMQPICPDMDLNGDKFVGVDEALPAYRAGIIGPNTPIYKRAFEEMYELATYWIDAFNTVDIDLLWREGKVGLRYSGSWEFSRMANDPNVTFERGFLPPPLPNSSEIPATDTTPGATDPPRTTAGDGTVPGDLLTAIQGSEFVTMASSTEKDGNLEQTIDFWMFLTEPQNNAFLVNENQARISSAVDAPLGSIWQEIATFKLPLYEYAIAWWGQGWYWDNDNFMRWRPVFIEWITGQIDEATFYERQEEEFAAGAQRYEEILQEQTDDS